MTGYTVHTGSTEKFTEGWDRIFKTRSTKKPTSTGKSTRQTTSKKKKKRGGK
jgi:hypothetical protein